MSENKQQDGSDNKQQGNFWRSLPGMITALGGGVGIAAIIAGIISAKQALFPQGSKPSPTSTILDTSTPTPKSDNPNPFKVYATSPKGTRFTNNQSSTKTYNFFAKGTWSYNPGVKKKYGAEGDTDYTKAKGYKLPGVAEGSLIVRRQNGSYQYVGAEKALTLDAVESVWFTINEANEGQGEKYNDNTGFLTVEWECEDCKP